MLLQVLDYPELSRPVSPRPVSLMPSPVLGYPRGLSIVPKLILKLALTKPL